ncbi:acyltransferase [Cellulosimicrobium funkei]|nr:acyltransferase [Cellulosimicrobium funkei]
MSISDREAARGAADPAPGRRFRNRQDQLVRHLPERRYIPELHGVRGLALAGVVLFHLFGNGRTSGGLDVFLAISGFLFTGMLLREAATSGGRIDLLKYGGRLARRIVIPAALVVLVTTVVGLFVLPSTQRDQLLAESRASLLYFENLELVNSQLAYGAAGPETSPFQHFWSLSVQGQFYLVWPLVAVIAVLVAKALKVPAARVMGVLVVVIIAASLARAIVVGGYDQDAAYLLTFPRFWELAFGGLLALSVGLVRLPRWSRAAACWLGLALMVSSGFVLDGGQLFPGPWALWPLLGLALVVFATAAPVFRLAEQDEPVAGAASRLLAGRVLGWVGNHAYGLYLWHWPILIYYLEIRDRESVGLLGGLGILVLATVLAMAMYRWIEQPLAALPGERDPRRAKRVNLVVIGTTTAALVLGGGVATAAKQVEAPLATVFEDWDWTTYPGAAATAEDAPTPPEADFVPAADQLADDSPEVYDWGCVQSYRHDPGTGEVLVCEDPEKPADPTATVVLAGGSHSVMWSPAVRALASEYGWELLVVNKSGCVFHTMTAEEDGTCPEWNDNFIDWADERSVDLVITPGTRAMRRPDSEMIMTGAQDRWKQITDTGAELLLVRGIPRLEEHAADCLASGGDAINCGADPAQMSPQNPLVALDLPEGAHTIDVGEYVCPGGRQAEVCPAVVGNVAVWNDESHLSTTFVRTMTPMLGDAMREELPQFFD